MIEITMITKINSTKHEKKKNQSILKEKEIIKKKKLIIILLANFYILRNKHMQYLERYTFESYIVKFGRP
jgi:hypothetical protein